MSGAIPPDGSEGDGRGGCNEGKRTKNDIVLLFLLFSPFLLPPASSLRDLSFRCIPTSVQSERYMTCGRGNYAQSDDSKLVGDCAARTGRRAVRNRRVCVARHHIVDAGGALRRVRAGGWNLRDSRVLQARRRGRAMVGAAV